MDSHDHVSWFISQFQQSANSAGCVYIYMHVCVPHRHNFQFRFHDFQMNFLTEWKTDDETTRNWKIIYIVQTHTVSLLIIATRFKWQKFINHLSFDFVLLLFFLFSFIEHISFVWIRQAVAPPPEWVRKKNDKTKKFKIFYVNS